MVMPLTTGGGSRRAKMLAYLDSFKHSAQIKTQ